MEIKKIWERRLPINGKEAKDEKEKKLARNLVHLRKVRIKLYEEQNIKDKENLQMLEILETIDKEYGLSEGLKYTLEIQEWCDENFQNKPIYERRLPTKGKEAKDEKEKELAKKLQYIKCERIKEYEGQNIEDIENEEDRQIVEIIRKLDKEYDFSQSLKNAMKIQEWCEENYSDKKIWERRLPSITAKEQKEKELGIKLTSLRNKIKIYEKQNLDKIVKEQDRKIVEIIRKLDQEYGLSESLKNSLEIQKWCEETFKDKPIWEKRLPNMRASDEYEKKLGNKLRGVKREKINQYIGKNLEEIENKEDRQIVEIIRGLDEEFGLGQSLKNAMRIQEWCEENCGDKKIWERRLPSITAKEQEESELGIKLATLRTQRTQKYQNQEIEQIEDEEDRQIVEIVRKLDKEYGLGDGLKKVLEIEEWCDKNFGDKKLWERKLPSQSAKDEYERKLGERLSFIRSKIKKYLGQETEDIENEEDRQIVEIIRRLDKEYNISLQEKKRLKEEAERQNAQAKELYEQYQAEGEKQEGKQPVS